MLIHSIYRVVDISRYHSNMYCGGSHGFSGQDDIERFKRVKSHIKRNGGFSLFTMCIIIKTEFISCAPCKLCGENCSVNIVSEHEHWVAETIAGEIPTERMFVWYKLVPRKIAFSTVHIRIHISKRINLRWVTVFLKR